jgi:hypothetical protein
MEPDKTFTSGSEVLRIEGHAVIPAYSEVKKEYDLGEIYKRDLDFQFLRGRVINISLFVEERLDKIINKVFVKREQDLNSLFQSVVLGREFFSFMAKWKILKDLSHSLPILKDKDYSSLITEIKEVIAIRDMFAHGKATHIDDGSILIDYFREKPQRDKIDSNFLDGFDKKARLINTELDRIYSQIQ